MISANVVIVLPHSQLTICESGRAKTAAGLAGDSNRFYE
jgi:hypothetical protein